jgi:hypothetical protein
MLIELGRSTRLKLCDARPRYRLVQITYDFSGGKPLKPTEE